ncbi:MAG: 16S rRNA (uracil(1498)-N(3))-methyltransferase [Microcella sp.]|uniref:16S rRNA (uracil(1498)-N(3))-methyltransferase n=1 Tax=Microcella sp. TaxID=1913979 RepID=UPI0024CDDA87|nr:16S rRNA (uracil(1498)-N(3))-methyltransferase [Microcella sp.]UYN84074.1 MAG: 16S rRNA (uracil(1498)-N(3))-methyltransferase [Microcella sp.]
MAHFYLESTLSEQLGVDENVVHLRDPDARHAVTVARVRVGEPLRLGDGAGLVVHAVVASIEPGDLALEVERVERYERPSPSIHLVQALAKGDRDELALQAATELGVDAVIPWQAARSVSRWDAAKAVKGRERWQTIAREASKQSMRPWMPEVQPLVTTTQLVARAADSTVLVLDPASDHPLTSVTAHDLGHRDVLVVVGPEGGITPDELLAFTTAGARCVRLGASVLRTSTAGPAAIAVLSAALGRW